MPDVTLSNRWLTQGSWAARGRGLIDLLNPVTRAPSAAVETLAWVDSFSPSLMPRGTLHQGMASGLSVLTARLAGSLTESATDVVVPQDGSLAGRLAVRGVIGGAGQWLENLPQRPDESLYRSAVRTGGWLLKNGAVSGALFDLGRASQRAFPSRRGLRPLIGTTAVTAGAVWWGLRRKQERIREIRRWPIEQKNALPQSVAIGVAISLAGSGLAKAMVATRKGLISYLGPGVTKNVLARATNAALWGAGLAFLYNAGVGYVGRANEKIEPAYAVPPSNPLVSGSPDSNSPFEDLGIQGRRYVSDVITLELIEEVMDEPARDHPIRVFVGFNTEPVYPTGRAELALAELDRTGAFDRSHLLLVSPTGTGWVNQTMIETAEFLTRGDIATCAVQYGRFPSFLSLQKVALGRFQFRLLLWGVRQRLLDRPPERRPHVYIYGESLGAWTASDVVMFQGIKGFDHYGIDRALWVGLPGMAKWSKTGMARGRGALVPEGTVDVFDRHQALARLSDEDKANLRAVILSHDNDPIAALSPEMIIQEPEFLRGGALRGRFVPDNYTWTPILTFAFTAVDAMNAMVMVPGNFDSFGHDYRRDIARFTRDTFQLRDVTEAQMERIEETLRRLELDRTERIKAADVADAPPSPAHEAAAGRNEAAGVPLVGPRARGARWLGRQRVEAQSALETGSSA